MKDFLTGRKINIKEKVLVVKDKVYSKDSYFSVDTRALEGYPPKVYYDKNENYLGKIYDEDLIELEDIEDIVLSYADSCFSNHDLDDLRTFLKNKREDFYKSIEKIKKLEKNPRLCWQID